LLDRGEVRPTASPIVPAGKHYLGRLTSRALGVRRTAVRRASPRQERSRSAPRRRRAFTIGSPRPFTYPSIAGRRGPCLINRRHRQATAMSIGANVRTMRPRFSSTCAATTAPVRWREVLSAAGSTRCSEDQLV